MSLDLSIKKMLENYPDSMPQVDKLREILQQAALLGLARHRFFEHAAFYGGTALRILYGLDRYSEDLDFSLLQPNPQFIFDPFLQGMQRELEGLGFKLEVSSRKKNDETGILSAFLKANTLILMLSISENQMRGVHPDQKIQVKLEIDVNPPSILPQETKLVKNPVPFYIRTYRIIDLFAGKMHAVLCRSWQQRVKGRDWYDLIWYVQNGIPVNLDHLKDKMLQTGHLKPKETLDEKKLQELLKQRIDQIDWKLAKKDVEPFIADKKRLDLWSQTFFIDVIKHLRWVSSTPFTSESNRS